MKKILFICDYIPPEHSATGRFAYYIAKELSKKCEVHLVALSAHVGSEKQENFCSYKVLNRYGQYQKMIRDNQSGNPIKRFLGKIAYRFYYLVANRKGLYEVNEHTKILKKYCQKIISGNSIDTIVSVSNPFANQEIAYELVKNNSKLHWFPYLMDSGRNNAVYKVSPELEKKYFQHAKKIFIVPALLNDEQFIEDFSDKIEVLDLPIIPADIKPLADNNGNIVFVYAGKFYEQIRNPRHLFEIFEMLPSNFILKLFYGGCTGIVEEFKTRLGDRLQVSGYVSSEELDKAIEGANIVVSLGNNVTNQVASKIYDMIAYGKPILNFYQREDDISLQHLEQYPLCKSVFYTQPKIDDIKDWCMENHRRCITYEEATCNMKEKRLEECTNKLYHLIYE